MRAAAVFLFVGLLAMAWAVIITSRGDRPSDTDRQWAIEQADLAECVVPQQLAQLPRLLTNEWGAEAAFNAGRNETARMWAQQLLDAADGHQDDPIYGGVIHGGNIILGRLALQAGDREAAKRHLLAAGNTPGSPVLGSFGPNVVLARDLLAVGEKEVVLLYFDQCELFWKGERGRLDEWRRAIHEGRTPEFGTAIAN